MDVDPESTHTAGTFSELTLVGDETLDDVIEIVDSLTQLAVDGKKRGTAHMKLHFEHEGFKIREPGDYWVVTKSSGEPVCVVRVTNVNITSFNQVGEKFAASEGEGDLSLKYWREAHKAYFMAQCEMWDKEWRDDMPIVCESFELVYKP
jgi:uncharacterized protein YhfF